MLYVILCVLYMYYIYYASNARCSCGVEFPLQVFSFDKVLVMFRYITVNE